MIRFTAFARSMVIVFVVLCALAGTVQAQQGQEETAGFDGLRALAISVGILGGATVATILTDGLIFPAYAWATGGELGAAGMASGGVAATLRTTGGAIRNAGSRGYRLVRGSIRLLGAASGGLLADYLYLGE